MLLNLVERIKIEIYIQIPVHVRQRVIGMVMEQYLDRV